MFLSFNFHKLKAYILNGTDVGGKSFKFMINFVTESMLYILISLIPYPLHWARRNKAQKLGVLISDLIK